MTTESANFASMDPKDLVVPSCVISLDATIEMANDAFLSLVGGARGALGGRIALTEYLTLRHPDGETDILAEMLSSSQPLRYAEVVGETGSGRTLRLGLSVVPRHGRDGELLTLLLILVDRSVMKGKGSFSTVESESLAEARRLLESAKAQKSLFGKTEDASALKENEALTQVHRHLEKAYGDMNEELEMAKSIQEGLMPDKLPDALNLKAFALYMPAGKVGGDLYDMIITPRQKVAVLIFDVSGHGVPAALIAAMAKMLFMHYIDRTESPAEVFTEVNKRMCRFVRSDHYLTAFLGILNPVENTMVYSKAGHVPPVVYHRQTNEVTTLKSRGFFIGHSALEDIAEYSEETIRLEPGDKMLFYTDGLTEGADPDNELYGTSRLIRAVGERGLENVEDFVKGILEDQVSFRKGAALRDDFTMLCVETGSPDLFLKESGFTREDKPKVLVVNSYRGIEDAASAILREMDYNGFLDQSIKRTKVCVYEMLTNALEHGNGNDPTRKAVVVYKVVPDKAMVSVVDEGDGFDYRHLPNPLLPENIFKDHGRGLFIVHKYMDEVRFNRKGNRILAVKYHHEGE